MKWPVAGLEARLKASIKRIFRSRQSHQEPSKLAKCTAHTLDCCDAQRLARVECQYHGPGKRWIADRRSGERTHEYQGSPHIYDFQQPTECTEVSTSEEALADCSKMETDKCLKTVLKFDACVNTDEVLAQNVQNALCQSECESNLLCTEEVNEVSRKRPRIKNASTQPMPSERSPDLMQHSDASYRTNLPTPHKTAFLNFSHTGLPETRHFQDAIQSNFSDCRKQYLTEPTEGRYIFAGDSDKRYMDSSTVYPNHANVSALCTAGWEMISIGSQNSVGSKRSPVSDNQERSVHMVDGSSFRESTESNALGAVWNYSVGAVTSRFARKDFRFRECSGSGQNRVFHASSVNSEVSKLITVTKPAKECGDESMPRNTDTTDLSTSEYKGKIGPRVTEVDSKLSMEPSYNNSKNVSSYKRQRELNSTNNISRSCIIPVGSDGLTTSSSSPCDRSVSGSMYERPQAGRQQVVGSYFAQRALKARPATAQSHASTRGLGTLSRKSEDLQMIHHNCTSLAKETASQRSERSELATRKCMLLPHSTSDDGDPSKMARMERSADRSSASSAYSKRTRASRMSVQASNRRNLSTSPVQRWRAAKQGGALPATRDLNVCPTGRHPEVKAEKPCICMMVKRMVIAQSKPVLYSWHARPPTTGGSSDSAIITVLSPPDDRLNADCHSASMLLGRTQSSIPSLPNFQLARPTRMVRGGQGTVAWVTDVATGKFYALKFKQREGRSDSTWAIERREAKLLRHAKHEFIVRLFHIYETEETLFMALEWLDGGCLWNHIARAGIIPECYAVYYGACILSALRYLHSKCIVYRDMKAENVVLDHRGRPKLIDFGMAKRFAMEDGREMTPADLTADSSVNDTDDFDQPPTRYYFAAYLAPEIYDHHEKTNHHIDSWGLGYILLEMLLGYGIFHPMPWEQEPGKHLNASWKLKLPHDSNSRMSPVCEDFVHKMLLRRPDDRMNLEQAQRHTLFSSVPWSNLENIRGPDLSKSNLKGTGATQAVCVTTGRTRRWMTTYDSIVHIPDLTFVRAFYGSIAHANINYPVPTTGLNSRASKIPKAIHGKGKRPIISSRSWTNEIERMQSISTTARNKATMPGNVIEVRSTQPLPKEASVEVARDNRKTRRHVGSAT